MQTSNEGLQFCHLLLWSRWTELISYWCFRSNSIKGLGFLKGSEDQGKREIILKVQVFGERVSLSSGISERLWTSIRRCHEDISTWEARGVKTEGGESKGKKAKSQGSLSFSL